MIYRRVACLADSLAGKRVETTLGHSQITKTHWSLKFFPTAESNSHEADDACCLNFLSKSVIWDYKIDGCVEVHLGNWTLHAIREIQEIYRISEMSFTIRRKDSVQVMTCFCAKIFQNYSFKRLFISQIVCEQLGSEPVEWAARSPVIELF